MPNPTEAARLKAEGNDLFVKKDFTAAYKKYTQAIKHDEQNAVLYCNRAACSLGLNRYLDAYTDAEKATKLDATYAKAWARLASACAGLGKQEETVRTWKRALAALPVQNLSAAELKQKEQYAAELAAAEARQARGAPRTAGVVMQIPERESPWYRAEQILANGQTPHGKPWNSSAWLIVSAHTAWATAMAGMQQLQLVNTPAGQGYFGRIGIIEWLSNAVIEDQRSFMISDQNFLDQYNKQVMFEMTQTGAWPHGSSRTVMEEAPKRVAREGWDKVRGALALTVRTWVMRAFIQGNLTEDVNASLDFYTSAIEVLRWGIQLWRDVPQEVKGAMFQDSFLRGVKCLRLDAMIKAYTIHPGQASKLPLSEILAGAQDLIDELASAPEEPVDESLYPFHLGFIRYPLAQAHSLRGFCHRQTAKHIRLAGGPASEVADHLKTATEAYLRAADIYPADDEKHLDCLHLAFECLRETGCSSGEQLALLNRIHDAVPVVKRIWEHSADWVSGRNVALQNDMAVRDSLLNTM
ncbi:hypothetical protein BV20DRAFT_977181 [Pilatotrama ljubarskyi]|nr:hypothetical protein BV20DRAFT_977181 [Pilatotrama ljubarskyi]